MAEHQAGTFEKGSAAQVDQISFAATPVITFLFTDIEASTRLWETAPAKMADALVLHDRLCAAAVEAHGGRLIKMIGDGLHAAFDNPADAVATALDLQRGMPTIAADTGLPFKMRCGLHCGAAQQRDGDFFGSAVNRAARIAAAAHGGQVLLSQAVVDLTRERLPAGADLLQLGRVRLRDLSAPENIWQLLHVDLPPVFPALRSLESTPNNLPQQLTSFVGRVKEMQEVKQLLGKTRLLTLTGSGGCGKTRLAMQVAAEVLESYPDGVWLVELAALADPAGVPQSVAMTLGLSEQARKSLTQTLVEHLASRRLLLVLDNAEHLLGACATLTHEVLRHCREVALLATSREPLGVDGELLYRVPSMAVPGSPEDVTPQALAQYESVNLFVERARLHLPRFVVNSQNARALASVCNRLDGIPLALELAAARVRSMSVAEIDSRLDHRFNLLTGGSRTSLPRQQTLRSLIDWSFDLLTEAEKSLLQRLSVFTGGWTMASAESMCVGGSIPDGKSVVDLLTALVDKSLALSEDRGGSTRYRLLETVRQYAREGLEKEGELSFWRARHLEHFVALGEEADPHLTGDDQQAWLDRLDREHDNLRAALAWSCARDGDPALGLRLAAAVWWFWLVRGYWTEGSGYLRSVIEASSRDPASLSRAKALIGVGALLEKVDDYAAARARFEQALSVYRELGDQRGIANSLTNLGNTAREQGNYAEARTFHEEGLSIYRALGPRWNEAIALGNLGIDVYDQGDYEYATTLYEQGLAIFRELGDRRSIALSLNFLGIAARQRGNHASAKALHDESLSVFRELGDRWGIAWAYMNLGKLAFARNDHASAFALFKESLVIQQEIGERLGVAETLEGLGHVAFHLSGSKCAISVLAVAERLRSQIGAPRVPDERARYDERVAAVRAAVGDDAAFDEMWREASTMSLAQAIECALSAGHDD